MTCEPTHNYLYTLYQYEWYEPMRLLIYRRLAICTLDLEPCPYSHILLSSTTIASVSLTCSPIAVSDPLASLTRYYIALVHVTLLIMN